MSGVDRDLQRDVLRGGRVSALGQRSKCQCGRNERDARRVPNDRCANREDQWEAYQKQPSEVRVSEQGGPWCARFGDQQISDQSKECDCREQSDQRRNRHEPTELLLQWRSLPACQEAGRRNPPGEHWRGQEHHARSELNRPRNDRQLHLPATTSKVKFPFVVLVSFLLSGHLLERGGGAATSAAPFAWRSRCASIASRRSDAAPPSIACACTIRSGFSTAFSSSRTASAVQPV
jgi:hypothetical protein